MSDDRVSHISQNLSLRLSPGRKYSPTKRSLYSPISSPTSFNPYNNICCHCFNYFPCCTCFNPCINIDSSFSKREIIPKMEDKEKTLENSLNFIQSLNNDIDILSKSNKYKIVYEPENRDQKLFNDFFKKLMEVESKLEDAKIRLAINPDFNCEDAFRIFDPNNKGFLTKDDIKIGLNLLSIFPTEKKLKLLMKRFDLEKNGYLNYADFFDMVVPFEKNYRHRVENRPPNNICCPCNKNDFNVFSEKTIYYLQNLFILIIDFEKEINDDRKLLVDMRVKLKDIFQLFDKNRIGHFTHDEMVEYFKENGILENIRDADLLFIRLDKNRNGKIDYYEVAEELPTLY